MERDRKLRRGRARFVGAAAALATVATLATAGCEAGGGVYPEPNFGQTLAPAAGTTLWQGGGTIETVNDIKQGVKYPN